MPNFVPGLTVGRGFVIGLLAALSLWVLPIPIAAVAWAIGAKRSFGDIMLLALPFLLLLPIGGALLGWRHSRRMNRPDHDDESNFD
jgi:hypothetical protein